MADELGTAVLRLELDTTGLKEALGKAKQQVEQELGTATTGTSRTRRTTPPSSAGVTGPGGGVDQRDLVRRFNLRASWNKFFDDAEQVRRDIQTSGETARKRSRADAQKRTKEVAANALIGVGFPLLFGQGLGAAAGGGLGGAAGALGGGTFGFAGSIAGTAIGAQLDLFIEKSKILARALASPIASFSEIQQASLLSSSGLERQIESLIAVGRSAEAAALIQQDLASRYSATTLAQVTESKKQEDAANRSFTQTTTTFGAFAAELGAKIQEAARRIFEPGFGIFSPERLSASSNKSESTSTTTTATRIEKERSALLSQQFKLITAQAQGYEDLALQAQKDISLGQQRLDIENLIAAKGATGDSVKQAQIEAEIQERINKGTLERFNIDERILQVAKERNKENQKTLLLEAAAAESLRGNRLAVIDIEATQIKSNAVNTRESSPVTNAKLATLEIRRLAVQQDIQKAAFTEFQTREQISRGIENTLQLLGTEQGQYRDTLGTIQQISATLDAARRKESEIGFQIDQARIGGRDEEASRLVGQQRTAALETRKLLTESAFELQKVSEALKEASVTARDNIRAAVLEFTRTRSDEQGLNRFLSPQQQQNRAEQDLKTLLPSFREAQSRFTALTGAAAPEFRGPTQDLNATVRDFIATVDREFQAGKDLNKARENLEQINKALVEVNTKLAKATADLAAKEWLVSVNVVNNANGSSTVDAVNGLTS